MFELRPFVTFKWIMNLSTPQRSSSSPQSSCIPFTRTDVVSFLISVPRVSTDGDAHEILTLIACASGVIVAVILILIILVIMRCDKYDPTARPSCENDAECGTQSTSEKPKVNKNPAVRRMSIYSLFGSRRQSFDIQPKTERNMSISTVQTEMSWVGAQTDVTCSRETIFSASSNELAPKWSKGSHPNDAVT